MKKETTEQAPRPGALLSATFLGIALFGAGFAQAQQPASASEAEAAPASDAAMRGIEKSDIRRGHARDSDADGDGLADATQAARQADLKKLADELVNVQRSAAAEGAQGDRAAATKVDAGNALNAGSMKGAASGKGTSTATGRIGGGGGAGKASLHEAGAGADPASEPVPALEPDPNP